MFRFLTAESVTAFALGCPANVGDDIAGRIRAEQINTIRRFLSAMMLANACNACVLVAALWSSPQRQLAVVWAAVVFVFVTYHGLKHRHSPRAKPSYVSFRSIGRAVRNALFLGTVWATLPVLFFADASAGGQVIITCLSAGMLAGGAFAFASMPAAAIAFTAPIAVGSAVVIGGSGDFAYFLVGVLMVSYVSVLWAGVFVHASQNAKRIVEQFLAEKRARSDELTGLPNRFALLEILESILANESASDRQLTILYLDLNDFKDVNDQFGHAAGDELLVQVAQRLDNCAKNVASVARLGGDEFAVVVRHRSHDQVAADLAKQIVAELDIPFAIDGRLITAGACIGMAVAPTDGESPEALLKSADEALYAAKNGTGGAVRIYDSTYKERARQRRGLERDLRGALARNEFFLEFQPILSLRADRIGGAEALLRWRHPTLGVREPREFIGLLEDTGLIQDIGHWIVRAACEEASRWPQQMRVAVNISAVQLRHTTILPAVVNALAASTLQPGRLELEITETTLIENNDCLASNLEALRNLGVRIALDDFGTGYSSLTYLRRLRPDTIKIDGSFVRGVLTDVGCASIVKSVIRLSNDLSINVVAEGIETVEQLTFIRQHNGDEGQGYFICKPKPAIEIAEFLAARSAKIDSAA